MLSRCLEAHHDTLRKQIGIIVRNVVAHGESRANHTARPSKNL